MEDGGIDAFSYQESKNQWVLILVLVEDGGIVVEFLSRRHTPPCLNPCFGGRWGDSSLPSPLQVLSNAVLILVLVEDGGIGLKDKLSLAVKACLNPCFGGRWGDRLQYSTAKNRYKKS